MSDYSIKDHVAYSMGFKDGKESQAATIAGLQAAVIQCRSLTELLKPQADRIAELEGALDFYACVDHYQTHNATAPNAVQFDRGAKARAALEGK